MFQCYFIITEEEFIFCLDFTVKIINDKKSFQQFLSNSSVINLFHAYKPPTSKYLMILSDTLKQRPLDPQVCSELIIHFPSDETLFEFLCPLLIQQPNNYHSILFQLLLGKVDFCEFLIYLLGYYKKMKQKYPWVLIENMVYSIVKIPEGILFHFFNQPNNYLQFNSHPMKLMILPN
jgi:hypothetical protein